MTCRLSGGAPLRHDSIYLDHDLVPEEVCRCQNRWEVCQSVAGPAVSIRPDGIFPKVPHRAFSSWREGPAVPNDRGRVQGIRLTIWQAGNLQDQEALNSHRLAVRSVQIIFGGRLWSSAFNVRCLSPRWGRAGAAVSSRRSAQPSEGVGDGRSGRCGVHAAQEPRLAREESDGAQTRHAKDHLQPRTGRTNRSLVAGNSSPKSHRVTDSTRRIPAVKLSLPLPVRGRPGFGSARLPRTASAAACLLPWPTSSNAEAA